MSRNDARMVVVRSRTTERAIVGEIDASQLRHQGDDAVHRVDDVGAGLPVHDDQHGALAVGQPRRAQIFHRALHLRDVAQPDGRPVAVGDDHRPVLVGLEELVVGADRPGAWCRRPARPWASWRSRAPSAVRTWPRLMPIWASTFGSTRARTAGFAPPPTNTWPTPSNCESFWARIESAASNRRPTGSDVRGQGKDHDRRVGRVDLPVRRIVRQIRRELTARGIDGGLHVARRGVDVPVEVELEDDGGGAEQAGRGHLGHAGDARELPLERRGHGGGHRLRIGPGQRRLTWMTGNSTWGSGATGSIR